MTSQLTATGAVYGRRLRALLPRRQDLPRWVRTRDGTSSPASPSLSWHCRSRSRSGSHSFLLELSELSHVRVVILRMSRVATLDATGAAVIGDAIKRLEERGVTVLLSGIRPGHDNVLHQLGVHDQLAHERHIFATTPEAITRARMHASRIVHTG